MTNHLKTFFHNFTEKPFTGYWNGKRYTFKPGIQKEYPPLIARHFAKHLTNEVLTASGKDQYASPKKPDEVPQFMEIFNKAFIVEEVAAEDDLDLDTGGEDADEPSMSIRTKPRESIDPYDAGKNQTTGPGNAPQVIGDEEPAKDDESEYEEPNSEGEEEAPKS